MPSSIKKREEYIYETLPINAAYDPEAAMEFYRNQVKEEMLRNR